MPDIVQLPSSGGPVKAYRNSNGFIESESGDTSPAYGAIQSGVWVTCPSIFRLRLTGTGTCVMDSRNSLGTVTSAVASYTAAAATDQIEYPYPGSTATQIRVTLTNTCTAEVL